MRRCEECGSHMVPQDIAAGRTVCLECAEDNTKGVNGDHVMLHVCVLHCDDTNHCTVCGRRTVPLRGPTTHLQGDPR